MTQANATAVTQGDTRALTILVSALGGEGGGVLADWIVEAARLAGLPAQATSVPGVAQRTGATSYYIEIMPTAPAAGAPAPVFALVPTAGRVDVLISSELLESGRMLERGFVSPQRTLFISSSSRVLTTMEKMQMGDGRFDPQRIHSAAQTLAKRYISLDLDAIAREAGTVVSATMFGALAGAGALPWPRALCEEAIGKSKRGVQQSLAGFAKAFDVAAAGGAAPEPAPSAAPAPARASGGGFAGLPEGVRSTIDHGVARVVDFQDEAYGELYLARMRGLIEAAPSSDDPMAAHALEEAARRLALWMAYEDIPRVADFKTRGSRFARIRDEAEMQPGQVLRVYEYLKPGAEEIADMAPRRIGEAIMRRIARGKSLPFLGKGMTVSTTGAAGFLTMRMLAKMRRLRRGSLRFAREQAAIERWLEAMRAALARSPAFAGALAEAPRLLKGYGETHQRGQRNYAAVFDGVVAPALAKGEEAQSAARLRQAIALALADPESQALSRFLAGEAAPPARAH